MTGVAHSHGREYPARRGAVQKTGGSSSLADVINIILDKGMVIDAWARVSVVGIEILTIEARVVVASVDTYLRYAEAIGTTALAAPPREGDRRNRHDERPEEPELPSEDEVAGYIEDHPRGVRLGELQAYFDAPRRAVGHILDQLEDEGRVRLDEDRNVYLPAGEEG